MNAKQRDVVFRRWSGVIGRETRDLDSLEQVSRRALADNDVRDDQNLQRLIQDAITKRRIELQQLLHAKEDPTASTQPRPNSRMEPPEAVPTITLEEARSSFKRLAYALNASLERADEQNAVTVLAKMQALQKQRPDAIPPPAIEEYEQRVETLRIHVQQRMDEIALLTQQAVSAARDGHEQALLRVMSRLTAIHAAHPRLLDEAALENVRDEVFNAADDRSQHRLTTKRLLDRERVISAEIKILAEAVRDFHRVACTLSNTSKEFREAEAKYLRTIESVRTYDTEWFSGVILELADLLAEWTEPPVGAERQIDQFLDGISKGLKQIRTEMRTIKGKLASDGDASDGDASEVPEN
jgi:hypothetical protein